MNAYEQRFLPHQHRHQYRQHKAERHHNDLVIPATRQQNAQTASVSRFGWQASRDRNAIHVAFTASSERSWKLSRVRLWFARAHIHIRRRLSSASRSSSALTQRSFIKIPEKFRASTNHKLAKGTGNPRESIKTRLIRLRRRCKHEDRRASVLLRTEYRQARRNSPNEALKLNILPVEKSQHRIRDDVAHIDFAAVLLYGRVSFNHQPADVREEKSASRVVRVRGCFRVFVVRPVISYPVVKASLIEEIEYRICETSYNSRKRDNARKSDEINLPGQPCSTNKRERFAEGPWRSNFYAPRVDELPPLLRNQSSSRTRCLEMETEKFLHANPCYVNPAATDLVSSHYSEREHLQPGK